MSEDEKLERSLENWRNGVVSIDEVRSLALDIGAHKYTPGISVLLGFLDHHDEMVRYNAAGSLATDFKYMPATERFLKMLARDPDEDCRSTAALCLGTLHHHTKNHEVLAALAKTSLEDRDEYVRDGAYRALLVVNGLTREEQLSILQNPPHVDENRVKTILGQISEAG